jgi:rhamnosyltransferase
MINNANNFTEICAVFVCFYPDLALFRSAVQALSSQVGKIVVVNNGADAEVEHWLNSNDLINLNYGKNVGVATAHNKGIEWALEHDFKFVLLMDQDSVASSDMVATMVASAARLEQAGAKYAAIGPRIVSMKTGETHPIIQLGFVKNIIRYDETMRKIVNVDILISSGSLIPLRVIDDIGGMNEGLFIDNVDLEWCFRASYKGYKLYLDPQAVLKHNLGDSTKNVWLFGNRSFVSHKPIRLYYMMRNRIILYSLAHTPRVWIMQDIYRVVAKFLIFSLLMSPRRKNAVMMLKGIKDGISGKQGSYQN